MTVCIAAICEYESVPFVLIAADRLITAGDIEYQPPQSKIYPLTEKVVALVAGDVITQSHICKQTFLNFRGKQNVSVHEVAEAFAGHFAESRLERNIAEILTPLGLTIDDLHGWIGKGGSSFVEDAVGRFYSLKLGMETIIAGVDAHGGHVYVVLDPGGVVAVHDDIGFAAIGGGEWHAQSQFMQAGYIKKWPLSWALFLIYLAARRAQVAPGVGTDIDLYGISSAGGLRPITGDPLGTELEKIYEKYDAQEQRAKVEAYSDINSLVQEYASREPEEPQVLVAGQDNGSGLDVGTGHSDGTDDEGTPKD